jgi:transposase
MILGQHWDIRPRNPIRAIAHWKHRLQKEMPEIFSARRAKREHDQEAFAAQLYQQIGQLKVELDWMKKNNEPVKG